MASGHDWKVPLNEQPKPQDYGYDLNRALDSIVGLRAVIPHDAFTAGTLGTERMGSGVVIDQHGLILTIGYLITEAQEIWITPCEGPPVPGHVLAYDQETGFGVVQALTKLNLPALELGDSSTVRIGDPVVVAGAGGRRGSIAALVVAKQEFAGYWEYILDEAIFTAPSHPNWGGTALIGSAGELLGIGSLQLQQAPEDGQAIDLNMMVPINLLKPILSDLVKSGRANRPPRPWLGLYATEVEDEIVVVGLATGGPAQKAGVRTGDIVLAAAGQEVSDLASLYRHIWAQGVSGVEVPLKMQREDRTFDVRIKSSDRNRFFKVPSLH